MSENCRNVLIIGIGGVTCGGKTTLANQLNNMLPNSKVFSQDDYFLDVDDPRHTMIPELDHINFDIITSLDMEKMRQDILSFINVNGLELVRPKEKNNVTNGNTMNDLKNVICNRIKEVNLKILIIEGFSIFNYEPILRLFHLKYYFTLSKEECRRRRDTRVYEPPDCPGYFEKCAWPEHLNQLEEVKKNLRDVTYFDENCTNLIDPILDDILKYL